MTSLVARRQTKRTPLIIFVMVILMSYSVLALFGIDNPTIPHINSASSYITIQQNISGNLTTFLELLDTPDSYAGEGSNCIVVNAGETALEFGECGTGGGGVSYDQELNTTSNVTFKSVNTTIIKSSENISFFSNNDLDDFFRLSTISNIPYLNIIGGDKFILTSDNANDLYMRAYEDSTHYCDFGWAKTSDFCYIDSVGGGIGFSDYVSFTNNVKVAGNFNVTKNITMGSDQFICGNSTCGQYIKFNTTGVYIQS